MQIYEGACQYCGQMKSVMAGSQEDADDIVTRQCDCDEANFEQRKEKLFDNIDEIAGAGSQAYEMDPLAYEIRERMKEIGVLVMQDQIQAVSINVDGTTVKISINSKGQVRVARKEGRSIGAKC